jgi:hypothetical protein
MPATTARNHCNCPLRGGVLVAPPSRASQNTRPNRLSPSPTATATATAVPACSPPTRAITRAYRYAIRTNHRENVPQGSLCGHHRDVEQANSRTTGSTSNRYRRRMGSVTSGWKSGVCRERGSKHFPGCRPDGLSRGLYQLSPHCQRERPACGIPHAHTRGRPGASPPAATILAHTMPTQIRQSTEKHISLAIMTFDPMMANHEPSGGPGYRKGVPLESRKLARTKPGAKSLVAKRRWCPDPEISFDFVFTRRFF